MDEYIKREDVKKAIRCKGENLIFNKGNLFIPFSVVRSAIENAPTADVTPKSEVVKDIFDEIDKLFRMHFDKSSQPVLSILEPIAQAERFIINEIWHDITELKKKYVEETTNGRRVQENPEHDQ